LGSGGHDRSEVGNLVAVSVSLGAVCCSPDELCSNSRSLMATGRHRRSDMGELGADVTTLLTDIAMGESARWHDGRFWCSDWVAGEILATDVLGPKAGEREIVARSTSFPFCFDWLPNGQMLVTGAAGLEHPAPDGSLVTYVDLTHLSVYGWNEVIVDTRANAYVNNVNFEVDGQPDFDVG